MSSGLPVSTFILSYPPESLVLYPLLGRYIPSHFSVSAGAADGLYLPSLPPGAPVIITSAISLEKSTAFSLCTASHPRCRLKRPQRLTQKNTIPACSRPMRCGYACPQIAEFCRFHSLAAAPFQSLISYTIFALPTIEKSEPIFIEIREAEKRAENILLDFNKSYPGELNGETINVILERARQRRQKNDSGRDKR
ncbi:MAG: hypothetical protein LBL15_06015 [Oscillospiraceae bacterium]|jgi:hypothetical protein|nr:hypothetical protein [Oscillospiraceae bacterium]